LHHRRMRAAVAFPARARRASRRGGAGPWDDLVMADSAAVRSRRYRLHKAGDHSACRHKLAVCAPVVAEMPGKGAVDPGAELEALAARLAVAHVADPGNASLARELRITLQALADTAPGDAGDDDPLAELRAIIADIP
jgi:hypothetical protein